MLSRDEFVLFGKFLRRLGDIAKPLATNSSTKTEPLSTVLTEINLAAAMIIGHSMNTEKRDDLPLDLPSPAQSDEVDPPPGGEKVGPVTGGPTPGEHRRQDDDKPDAIVKRSTLRWQLSPTDR